VTGVFVKTIVLGFSVASVVAGGCDLLQTRDPESPSGQSSSFEPATTPSIVITNLQNAVQEKNKENYRRCLVDTSFSDKEFQFQPTAEAAARYVSVFTGWSVTSEEEYFRNLSESRGGSVARLDFFNQTTTTQSQDEVLFAAKYHLVFQHQNSNLPQEARGNLQFYIARDQRSTWSIYRWIDTRDTSQTTWSDFKATFR